MEDITSTAALIFIDSLGHTLPFQENFSFQDLSDFCRREGIHYLSNREELTEDELLKIAFLVGQATNGHVTIETEPVEIKTSTRTPLSRIDLNVAQHKASFDQTCKRCGVNSNSEEYCNRCFDAAHRSATKTLDGKKPIELYAYVTLKDGNQIHVVEINGSKFIGVDNGFVSMEFTGNDVKSYQNMSEDLDKIATIQCKMCGEGSPVNSSLCYNCGYTWY